MKIITTAHQYTWFQMKELLELSGYKYEAVKPEPVQSARANELFWTEESIDKWNAFCYTKSGKSAIMKKDQLAYIRLRERTDAFSHGCTDGSFIKKTE